MDNYFLLKNENQEFKCLIFTLAAFFILALGSAQADESYTWPKTTLSKDKTPISYEVHGKGEPTLVFVHGWSCDSRYWKMQVPYFSDKFRVVTIDIAGHGHSGSARKIYSIKSFGEDVKAVVEDLNPEKVILIGHSMGGPVIAEAAALMPGKVIGLIGVDTLTNIETKMTREGLEKMIAPLEDDFKKNCKDFVNRMISKNTDKKLRDWILTDMSSANPYVAISSMNEMLNLYITGRSSEIFKGLKIPVRVVNADLWPVNYMANKRHMHSFKAIIIKNSDHFLMMNRPQEFNPALEKTIDSLIKTYLK